MADLKAFLPLKPVELLLLLALVGEDKHGYALARDIAERSEGTVRLEPGNLYRVIKRLIDDGLVAAAAHRPAADANEERRQYYRITALGARVAAAEAQRLRHLLSSSAVHALPVVTC